MTIAIPLNHLAEVLKGFRILSADVLDLPRNFLTWNVKHQLHHATLNLPESEARGFTAEGALALREIARSIRNAGTWQKAVTREQLEKKLASELLSLLADDREPKAAELRPKLEARLVAWLSEITQTRLHAVPIVFLPQRIARFSIGPVDIVHRSDLASPADFGIEHHSATPASEEFHRMAMQRIDQTLASRNAQWVALVRVSNREKSVSVAMANNTVDIALGAFQALVGTSGLSEIGRVGGRLSNWESFETWFHLDGSSGLEPRSHPPGASIDIGELERWMVQSGNVLEALGRRVRTYLDGGNFPKLNESWCEAAYWYHEACAERLETMHVARLETSLEVLFRAENGSGSTRRILEGFEVLLGLDSSKNIGTTRPITVKKLVEELVQTRSQVLHGTWPTLTTDLPGHVSTDDLSRIARRLLVLFGLKLDRYTQTPSHTDDVASFLSWVREQTPTDPVSPGVSV
ncbi:hypothetical protein [Nitratireductor soli]|uniref:hypothetical protein n=1 Tax=Nitratireductor soli TaxID=1670619 RepID=UPI000B282456|nr:hypothetical protein [Nitratireductor soli]